MEILVNGKAQNADSATIADLVRELDLRPEGLLIEHNGIALLRSEWPQKVLAEGDRLEILRVTAGG